MDLESGASIAKAFRDKQREFLGIYLGLRDRITSARAQAAMALRYHAEKGNLKWVALILWAGADARLAVPRIEECDWDEEDTDTALNAAVRYGHVEIVKKIGLHSVRDDVTRLLNQYFIQPKPQIIELLITAGADVSNLSPNVIDSVFSCFEWSLDTNLIANPTHTEDALQCMEILRVEWCALDFARQISPISFAENACSARALPSPRVCATNREFENHGATSIPGAGANPKDEANLETTISRRCRSPPLRWGQRYVQIHPFAQQGSIVAIESVPSCAPMNSFLQFRELEPQLAETRLM